MPDITTVPPNGFVPNGGLNEAQEQLDIGDNEWTSGYDVEPLVDGIRRRLGPVYASDSIGTEEEGNATGGDDYTALSSSVFAIAQQFVLVGTEIIEGVTVSLKMASQPALPFEVFCKIVEDDAGSPDSAPLSGFSPSAFNSLLTSQISDTFADHEFNMVTPTELAAGTYWIVVLLPNITSGFEVVPECKLAANPYADGEALSASGDVDVVPWFWVGAGAGDDLVFSLRKSSTEIEFTAIHDFHDQDGTQRHLVCLTQTVYKNVGGALSSVGAFDSPHTKDVHPSFISVDGRVAATNGESGDPSKTLYLAGGSDQWQNEGISKPIANLSLTPQTSGGFLADGVYYVDYFYLNTAAPREIRSNPRYEGDSAAAVTATIAAGGGAGSIDVTGHATAVARTGDRVDRKAFYVLGPGTGNRWVRAVLGGSVESVTLATGGTLTIINVTASEAEFDHDLAPTHSIKCAAGDRQFIAGIEGNPRRVMHSRARGGDIDVESYPSTNFQDVGLYDDRVTSLSFVPPAIVLVGMTNSIWAIDSTQPNRKPESVSQGIGIAGQNAVTVIGDEVFFWSNSPRHKGPYRWSTREGILPLVKPEKTVNGVDGTGGLNASRMALVSCARYEPDRVRFQWWTLVTQAGSVAHDMILVYDYKIRSWTRYRLAGNILGTVEVSGRDGLFIGTVAGRELRADQANDDLGSSIEGTVTLKPLTFGDMHARALIRGIVTRSKSTNLGDLLLQVLVDLGSGDPVSVTLNQAGAAGSILGTGLLGAFVLAGSGEIIRKTNFRVSGRMFTLTLTGTANWELNRMALLAQSSGRRSG